MTISIVIPTYNGEKYIEQALKSVLSQTRAADEILISDDNSTDNTLRICENYKNKIKIHRNPKGPSGFVNGWNNAISLASGDFISILHQDDLIAPTFLEEIENAINQHPDVKHFFVPCIYIDANGSTIRTTPLNNGEIHRFSGNEYIHRYVFTPGHIHRCPGVVTHRSIFEKCRYRKEAGHIADDDFFFRVGNHTDIVGIGKLLASYREHTSSETGHLSYLQLNHRLLKDHIFQLKHRNENPLFDKELQRNYKKWRNTYCRRLILSGLKSGELKYVLSGLLGFTNTTL